MEKKYKKCCMEKDNLSRENKTINKDIDFYETMMRGLVNIRRMTLKSKEHIKKYYKIRDIHEEILNSMVNYYEMGKYDFNKGLNGATKSIGKELNGNLNLFHMNFVSNNESDMRFFYRLLIYKHHPLITSITEEYISKNKFKNEEKVKLLNGMNNSYVGLFQILNIDKENAYVEIEDVFTDKKFKVIDTSISISPNAFDVYMYNRVVTYEDISFFDGANIAFAKNDLKIKKYIKEHKGKDFSELIRCLDLHKLSKSGKVITSTYNI